MIRCRATAASQDAEIKLLNVNLKARKILGVPVLGTPDELREIAVRTRAEEVVLARPEFGENLEKLRLTCEELDLPLYLAPVSRDFLRL